MAAPAERADRRGRIKESLHDALRRRERAAPRRVADGQRRARPRPGGPRRSTGRSGGRGSPEAPAEPHAAGRRAGRCVREAPPGREKPWHAIACSTGKRYLVPDDGALRVPGPAGEVVSGPVCYEDLDFALLSNALQRCRGRFDFKAFANNAPTQNPWRWTRFGEIRSIEAEDELNGVATVQIELDGALYFTVRNVVGACVACGTGKLKLDELTRSSRDARRAATTRQSPRPRAACASRPSRMVHVLLVTVLGPGGPWGEDPAAGA